MQPAAFIYTCASILYTTLRCLSLTEAPADEANRRVHLASSCSRCFIHSSSVPSSTSLPLFFFPDILFFLLCPSSPHTHHLLLLPNPSPHLVYITTSLRSTAAPHRRCHGNSGTTAGWLPLLPGGVASQPPPSLLSSCSLWRSPSTSARSMNQDRNVRLDQSQPNNSKQELSAAVTRWRVNVA